MFNAQDILGAARTGAVRKLVDYQKAVPAPYNSRQVPGNVWHMPRVRCMMPEYEDHATQKPASLRARMVLASSNEGDLILDPFAGSFTPDAVARALNRRSIGIERELAYVQIGLRRVLGYQALDGIPLSKPARATRRRGSERT